MPVPQRSWKALGEFIRAQRTLADMSLRQLAAVAKVSNPYLSQVERGLHKPSAEVIKSIADALQISAETLYAKVGLIDQDGAASASVEEAIRTDPALDATQKDVLIRLYRSYVGPARAPTRGGSPRRKGA